jgi:hypothetical protein
VTGAAGAYGGYVIQLAKAEGLTVIADASERDEELAASLGADIVVRRGDDVASRFRSHFPQGVDGLADGAVLNERVIPTVRDGGAFTSLRGFQCIPQRDIRFATTFLRSYAQEWEKLVRLRKQVEACEITLRVAEIFPPERAADAHRRLERRGTRGRLKQQTMLENSLRGLVTEFGLTGARGIGKLPELIALMDSDETIPDSARRAAHELYSQCDRLTCSIEAIEAQIVAHARGDERARRLATIPGIGPITASLIVASVVDFSRVQKCP